jgi:hypothetical protein
VESVPNILREGYRLGVAEDLDRFAGGIHDESAIAASGKMLFEVVSYAGVEPFF